jgi:hypothetical protein
MRDQYVLGIRVVPEEKRASPCRELLEDVKDDEASFRLLR